MEKLDNLSSGAGFVRADLHIHSYGINNGSFDVADQEMTPEKIVDTGKDISRRC